MTNSSGEQERSDQPYEVSLPNATGPKKTIDQVFEAPLPMEAVDKSSERAVPSPPSILAEAGLKESFSDPIRDALQRTRLPTQLGLFLLFGAGCGFGIFLGAIAPQLTPLIGLELFVGALLLLVLIGVYVRRVNEKALAEWRHRPRT
jgi:hypothetical protein